MKNSSTIMKKSLLRLGEGMGGADDSIPAMKKRLVFLASAAAILSTAWLMAQPAAPVSVSDEFRLVEVASVSDAIEQLYGQKAYMSHDMRPLAPAKFAGPAVTVLLKPEEHKEGSAASQGMLDAIDNSPAGSVYVMVVEDGANYAGIGGLMATAMKYRGFAGAVIDASVRDTPQIRKLQFPVFSRGVAPSTTINHYRVTGVNVPVTCAGVRVNPGDIVTADEDGVAVVPQARAPEILKKAQELDDTEHRMIPFIEKFRSIREAVKQFGRI
jgi:4-hydroxy-4-methyl-2-oxoglutarate aldolase